MAIGKAARWISFATTQQTPTSSSVTQDTFHPAVSFADEKQFGLENFGNTCYANSVLQALYFCSPFRDLVIQSTDISAPPLPAPVSRQIHPSQLTVTPVPLRRKSERGKPVTDAPPPVTSPTPTIPSTPPTLFSALRSLYVYISRHPSEKGTIAPRAFIDKLRDGNELFRGAMHQDAHEFLNYLLNKIVEEMQDNKHHRDKDVDDSNTTGEDLSPSTATVASNDVPTLTVQSDTSIKPAPSYIDSLKARSHPKRAVSSRDESFLDLSIDIEQNSSVTACLRQFSASEMLCQRNKFFCDSCCGLQEAEKRMKIKKLPNVLALHLKRFKYQEDLKKYIKLTYRVAFPFELRLFNTVDEYVFHVGPHHGHYVAIVRGPQSWLIFDDDKIEPIKESEIPRYFGDAPSGSAYVLYYQAVDLDLASLGIKPPPSPPPTAPEVAVAGASAAAVATNGTTLSEPPEPALPPGLGEPSVPATAPALHPPIPVAPSSPALITSPLLGSVTLPSRKKSLPSLRISGTSDLSSTSPTTPNRATGGLFHSLRSSPSGSRLRPSTSEGIPSPRTPALASHIPPVPPVPSQFTNGREHMKDKEKEGDKGWEKEREREREKEREEGRSSKEFDRKPTLWFKRRSFKPTKDEREKEKEKDVKGKGKDTSVVPVPTVPPPSQAATSSTTALLATPSQSDAASSASGTTSLWRRSSARLGHHVKRLSGSQSSTALGELDAAVTAGSPTESSSIPPQLQQQRPRQLSAVPATPQSLHPDEEPSSPTTSASESPTFPPTLAQHRLSNTDDSLPPPLAPDTDGEAGVGPPGDGSLPELRVSPASPSDQPSHQDTTAFASTVPHRANEEPSSATDDHDADADDADDDHHRHHTTIWSTILAGRRRGRPHSIHGSGSRTPREQSTSSREAPPLPAGAESGSTTLLSASLANGVLSSSTTTAAQENEQQQQQQKRGGEKEKEPGKPRRTMRKLSLHAPMFGFGLGFGLGGGGREKDREKDRDQLGKKEDGGGKKALKAHLPSAFGSGGAGASASAAVASATRSS
ncbi:hypothetical protein BGW80DRAFT_1459189 [Lactifluus volemus]|nr:hypothetical protein BGW80DRAFT_1459189 [Lactifluus volemus]